MKERPILFSGPMVRAILEGRKTQTRRALKPRPLPPISRWVMEDHWWLPKAASEAESVQQQFISTWPSAMRCPYGKPGVRLWVRETYHSEGGQALIRYKADGDALHELKRWKPSIHMPRWASRIDLEITGIRVERLQDISEDDCIAEGIEFWTERGIDDAQDYYRDYSRKQILWPQFTSARESYRSLFESINGPGSWDRNDWVWVIEFKRVEGEK